MRRFLLVVTALAAALFVTIPPAMAGGPTSVLVANYTTGRAAAVLYTNPAYSELQSILGDETRPAAEKPPAGLSESGNATVRMVWLIHDVSPWRIDNVHVQGKDVWVETYLDASGADPYAGQPIWHRPARGADLLTTLTTLGVVGSAGSGGSAASPGTGTSSSADGVAASGPEAAAPRVADSATGPTSTGAPWWLAATLGAVGLGVGATVGRRVTPRLHPGRPVTAVG